ncbi:SPOR domain-containing protein [Parvibaculum sp.]|jgi:Tfp pilus assembly protein PilF|uniref:SPOR domain-containing protein n=1 Tax=Parvibaculum sp. TaxID=2024848 RepID=UPI0032EB4E8E
MRGLISVFQQAAAVLIMAVLVAGTSPRLLHAEMAGTEAEAAALMRAGADAIERGHYDKAAVDFSNALDSGGLTLEGRALAWHHRGIAFQKIGQQDAAIADYTRAIDSRELPGAVLSRAYYNRGIAYGDVGDNTAAERDYAKVVDLAPDYAPAYHNLANLERRRGAHAEAIDHYSSAISNMNGRERRLPLFGRALSSEHIGDIEQAVADLKLALSIDPEFDLAATKLSALEPRLAEQKAASLPPAENEPIETAKVVPATVAPFQTASSGHEGGQLIRISSIGGWRTTATRFPREEEAPATVADTSTGHGDLITGSLRPTDDIPASDKKPLRLTKAEPAPAAKAAAAIPEARYRVQLGAFREEQLAQRAWEEISRDAVPLVGQSSPAIQKADLGERGIFYRLQAGAFGQIAEAKSACRALEKRKIACFVVEG